MSTRDRQSDRDAPTLVDELVAIGENHDIPINRRPLVQDDEESTQSLDAEAPCVAVDADTAAFLEALPDAYAMLEVVRAPSGATFDLRIADVNPAFEGMCDRSSGQLIGERLVEVLPDIEPAWIAACGQVEQTGLPVRIESFSSSLNMNLEVLAFRTAPGRVACLFQDVTERARSLPPPDADAAELRALVLRLDRSTESERAAVAEALERTIESQLTNLGSLLGTSQAMLDTGKAARASRALDDALSRVSDMATAARALIGRLRPSQLEERGLFASLGWYAERYSMNTDLLVLLEGSPPTRRLPYDAELALFRVVEEALANVAAHSGATRATVRVEETPAALVLTIRDEGVGFDLSALRSAGQGLGLAAMRERVAAVGGSFQVDTTIGQGTLLTAAVPFPG